jgi:hypothetical protein
MGAMANASGSGPAGADDRWLASAAVRAVVAAAGGGAAVVEAKLAGITSVAGEPVEGAVGGAHPTITTASPATVSARSLGFIRTCVCETPAMIHAGPGQASRTTRSEINVSS